MNFLHTFTLGITGLRWLLIDNFAILTKLSALESPKIIFLGYLQNWMMKTLKIYRLDACYLLWEDLCKLWSAYFLRYTALICQKYVLSTLWNWSMILIRYIDCLNGVCFADTLTVTLKGPVAESSALELAETCL